MEQRGIEREKLGQEVATIFGMIVVAVVEMELGIVVDADADAVVEVGGVEERVTRRCYSSLARQLGLQVGKEHNMQNYVGLDWMTGGREFEG